MGICFCHLSHSIMTHPVVCYFWIYCLTSRSSYDFQLNVHCLTNALDESCIANIVTWIIRDFRRTSFWLKFDWRRLTCTFHYILTSWTKLNSVALRLAHLQSLLLENNLMHSLCINYHHTDQLCFGLAFWFSAIRNKSERGRLILVRTGQDIGLILSSLWTIIAKVV